MDLRRLLDTWWGRIGIGLAGLSTINFLLWAGQGVWHRADIQRAHEMESALDTLDAALHRDSIWLETRNFMVRSAADRREFDRLMLEYNDRVLDFNAAVREYEELANRAYSRWYLLPIPVLVAPEPRVGIP